MNRVCGFCKKDLSIDNFRKRLDGQYRKRCVTCNMKQQKRIVKQCMNGKHKDKYYCKHGIQKYTCRDCNGSNLCPHDLQKQTCKSCNDPLEITLVRMLRNTLAKDKRVGMYDEKESVDIHFLRDLVEKSNNICVYCQCLMQHHTRDADMMTLERIDNNRGHVKDNVCFACFKCNIHRVGQKTQ